jgi:ribonuclease VapC
MSENSMYVFDSWAILAWLQDERPAAQTVDELLTSSDPGELEMSRINAGEIFYIIAKNRSRQQAEDIRQVLERMPISLSPVTHELVWHAAELKASYPLSYADAFGAALALGKGATLVTGDQEFEPLESAEGLSVQWLQRTG